MYKYTGDFIGGKNDGYGVKEYNDGIVYEGNFKNNVYQG